MSSSWRDDDEEYKVGGGRGGLRSKPRFSFTEVKLLLESVKRNRYIILKKFNHGVSAEAKKQTWAEITNQINSLGENHREVRQIMKKWADLKCDGKRRIVALRGPNGSNLRKKKLGPVEKMVHKILIMSPRGDGDSEPEFGDDEEFSKAFSKGLPTNATSFSYLNLTDNSYTSGGGEGASFEVSPPSSPEKDAGGDLLHSSSDFDLDLADDADRTMDFDNNEDSLLSSAHPSSLPPPLPASLDPLPDDARLRGKPVHTYSRNNIQNHSSSSSSSSSKPPPGPSTPSDVPDRDVALSSAAPPPPQSPSCSNGIAPSAPPPTSAAATYSTSPPAPTSSTPAPHAAPSAPSSNSHQPSPSSSSSTLSSSSVPPPPRPSTAGSKPPDPLPAGASSRPAHDHVAQVASQSLQQQRASRMLLTSVSQSLETLAQSVQLLVEAQQEFVQESLLLQRETVDILRDFSNTALTMLRDKANSGQHASRF